MQPDQKLDINDILANLKGYRPRRRGWTWRTTIPNQAMGPFVYQQTAESLKQSVALPAAKYFGGIDPQPDCVITTEIASGRFEDDLRRMRMAAWHGADHIMVIRTAGQSHFDGLIEGTPEGVGGVPISRKQVRATRKALDMIEDEVGRPINFHSYVSGVAGPEIAVLFAEEGVNGAHQDPQYNVLYRNINMFRSFVDAGVAKRLMVWADMAQIDGAHNANATAREGWKVMPELLVQHAINTAYSYLIGMKKDHICLSTVPPTASPGPALRYDLPYAVALRELFKQFRMRAQMNTRYIESDTREATVTHALNVLISRLTSADIQSTITPDEGRNVPWHYNNIHAINTAKQALLALDGLMEMVELKADGPLRQTARELKERAVLFMEEILEVGGYFAAVEQGFFVDSGYYPERNGDGIARDPAGGIAADTIVPRDDDYFAPVCAHFGHNRIPGNSTHPCDLISGCTLCHPEKIIFVDELDPEDNVERRLEQAIERVNPGQIRPEVEWSGDGLINLQIFLPTDQRRAAAVAAAIAARMGIADAQVIHQQVMQPAEGTYLEVKGKVPFAINLGDLILPEVVVALSTDQIRARVSARPLKIVAATLGQDEHSVGMREIIDLKHGGLEGFGIKCHYLGTSVAVQKLVDAAIEIDADAILVSTIITHADIHRINLRRLSNLCLEMGVRHRFLLVAGGTQVSDEMAKECGLDAGFGRGTKGLDVASFLVQNRQAR